MSGPQGRRRLATVTIPAPDLRPDGFLRQAEGQERGFWARGERWVAHRGVAAELRGAGPSQDRFEEAAAGARRLASEPILPEGTPRAARVRFYGGFSFRSDHAAEGVWAEFPNWLFHVPVFELEGDGSGDAWLRARELVGEGEADGVFIRLRHRAEALRAELATLADLPAPATGSGEGRAMATDRSSWAAPHRVSAAAPGTAGRMPEAPHPGCSRRHAVRGETAPPHRTPHLPPAPSCPSPVLGYSRGIQPASVRLLTREVQETLQTATVESHDDLVTDHDHRRGRLSGDGEERVAGLSVFCNITIGKGNAMIGKKLFHAMA